MRDYKNIKAFQLASLAETEHLLHLTSKLGYLKDELFGKIEERKQEVAKTLFGLIEAVKREV